ncbi:MAG: hypothetical protein EA384_15655 [Spirochaetaceae bacterium]|nr:MAG: hypothetical protein EA384_15655 [Spirochaetaceae bacterium]
MCRRWLLTVTVLLLCGALPVSAQDADAGAGTDHQDRSTLQRGGWFVSGYSSAFGFAAWVNADSADGEADSSAQGLSLAIAGGYFVADHLAVGPEVSIGFTRLVDPGDSVRTEVELALGLQGAYFLELPDWRWVPLGRLAVAYERTSVRDDAEVKDRIENGFSISPKLGVLYFFTNRLTGGAEAVYRFTRKTTDSGDTTVLSHAAGLAIGVTLFFP